MEKAFTLYEYFTLYLVNSDVRPACLLYDSQYTEQLDKNIKLYFPELKIYYDNFFGYIISKKKIQVNKNLNSDDIGYILGYPQDEISYTKIDDNKDCYSTHIIITMTNDQEISLLDVKTQNSVLEKMKNIMYAFSNKLLLPDCLYYSKIKYINIREDIIHPIDYYCQKLIKKDDLTDDDISNIMNNIWNIFGEKIAYYNYDYKNDFHIGIIISLLLYCKNNPIEQFYGPYYGKCETTKKIIETNKNYSDDILSIIKIKTTIP